MLGGESRSPAGRALFHQTALLPQGMSETFETLHNLVHKGVKVVMDIPYELWNETSAEVADLKKQVLGPVGLALGSGRGLVGWSTGRERVWRCTDRNRGVSRPCCPVSAHALAACSWSWALLSMLV